MNFLVQFVNGCKTIVEAIASSIGFDNSTTTLTATDVQGAIEELAAASGAVYQFSIKSAKPGQSILIPQCQQMVLCADQFCVEDDGEFCIEDDAEIVLI